MEKDDKKKWKIFESIFEVITFYIERKATRSDIKRERGDVSRMSG